MLGEYVIEAISLLRCLMKKNIKKHVKNLIWFLLALRKHKIGSLKVIL